MRVMLHAPVPVQADKALSEGSYPKPSVGILRNVAAGLGRFLECGIFTYRSHVFPVPYEDAVTVCGEVEFSVIVKV